MSSRTTLVTVLLAATTACAGAQPASGAPAPAGSEARLAAPPASGAHVDVRAFGARGDGEADDTAAIQAAIDSLRPSGLAAAGQGGTVRFPPGVYRISAPIRYYGAQRLVGAGRYATTLLEGPAFRGDRLLQPALVGGYHQGSVVEGLSLLGASAWGLAFWEPGNFGYSEIHDVALRTPRGLALYGQALSVHDVHMGNYPGVPHEQFIRFAGNWNHFAGLAWDANSTGGRTADPIIHGVAQPFPAPGQPAQASRNNVLDGVLIEQVNRPDKPCIRLEGGTWTTLRNLWFESVGMSGGSALEVDGPESFVTVGGMVHGFGDEGVGRRIRVTGGAWLELEATYAYGSTVYQLEQGLDVDASSTVRVHRHNLAGPATALPFRSRIQVDHYARSGNWSRPNVEAQETPASAAGHNLLVNPSFEAGLYRWRYQGPGRPSLVPSGVGVGQALRIDGPDGAPVQQAVTVTQEMVGLPLTFTLAIRKRGAGAVVLLVRGAGVELDAAHPGPRQAAEDSWGFLSATFTPAAAGPLQVGAVAVGAVEAFELDEATLFVGRGGQFNGARFGSLELGGATVAVDDAAPRTGTWKAGDVVINGSPAPGSPVGWRCTGAGSPGRWEPIPGRAAAVPDAPAAPTRAEFNELLARLRAAGLLAP